MTDGARASGRQGQHGPTLSAPGKLRVFISYSRDDLAFADQLVAGLELCSFEPTLDRHGISGGEAWERRLGSLIREADTVVFVVSPSSAKSDVCAWEVGEATRLNKRIIPVICRPLEGASPPQTLRDLNYIFFFADPSLPGSGFGSGLARLVAALNTDLDWLREHTRLLQRATEWDAANRPSNRLLSGADITDAKEWAAARPTNAPELTVLHLDFIRSSEAEERSRDSAERKRLEEIASAQATQARALAEKEAAQAREAYQAQRVVRRTRYGILAALFLATLVGWKWWEAEQANIAVVQERDVARVQTTKAEAASLEADMQRRAASAARAAAEAEGRRAVAARARQMAVAAASRLEKGDPIAAITMALDALPPDQTDKSSSDWPHIQLTLDGALRILRERKVYHGPQIGAAFAVRDAAFSADGQQVVTASREGAVRIFDRATGDVVRVLEEDGVELYRAWLSSDGQFVAALGRGRGQDRDIHRLWSLRTGELISDFKGIPERTGVQPILGQPRVVSGPFGVADPEAEFRSWGAAESVALGKDGRLSPDGSRFLRKSGAARMELVDALDGRVITQHADETRLVSEWVFSASGQHYAIAWASDAIVDVFDSATGTHRGRVTNAAPVGALRLSDDGTTLINLRGRRDGGFEVREIAFYDVKGGKLRAAGALDMTRHVEAGHVPPPAELHYPFDIVVAPDGGRVLVRTFSRDWELWDGVTGRRLSSVGSDIPDWPAARFSPDGTLLATPHKDEAVRLWRASDGARIATLAGHQHSLRALEFSSDGLSLLTAANDGTARLWSVEPVLAGRLLPTPTSKPDPGELVVPGLHLRDQIEGVAFSPDGRRLLVAQSHRAILYDVPSGRQIRIIETQFRGDRGSFLADGRNFMLVARRSSFDSPWVASIYSGDDGHLIRTFVHPVDEDIRWSLAGRGKYVVGTSKGGSLLAWNASTGDVVLKLDGLGIREFASLAIDRDEQRALVATKTGQALIVEIKSGAMLATLPTTGGLFFWSRDGSRVANYEGIWDIRTAKLTVPFDRADCGGARDWSEANHRLAFTHGMNSVVFCLMDAQTGKLVRFVDHSAPERHSREIGAVQFVAGGRRAVTAADDDSARIWDSATGKHIALLGRARREMAVDLEIAGRGSIPFAVSADGQLIVTGHSDGVVRVWEAMGGGLVAELKDLGAHVSEVAIDSSGRFVAAGSDNNRLYLWPLEVDLSRTTAMAVEKTVRCLGSEERLDVGLEPSLPDWCFEFRKWPAPPVRAGFEMETTRGSMDAVLGKSRVGAGVRVVRVYRNLPADGAGIRVGDAIIEINGTTVHDAQQVIDLIAKVPTGTAARFKVYRGEAPIELDLMPRP